MPAAQNIAAQLLARNQEQHPDKAAYLCGEDALTYRALATESARFANLLFARGVRPGDRVLLALPDSFASPKAILGALLLGATPVLAGLQFSSEDYAFILRDCTPSALITWEGSPAAEGARLLGDGEGSPTVLYCGLNGPWGLADHSAHFEPIAPPKPSQDAPGFLLYSSGSTGTPQSVRLAQADLFVPTQEGAARVLPTDILLAADKTSASTLSSAHGLKFSLGLPLALGTTAVLLPRAPGAHDLYATIARHLPTLLFCTPAMYSLLLQDGEQDTNVSSLRLCFCTGTPLPGSLNKEWKQLTGLDLLDSGTFLR